MIDHKVPRRSGSTDSERTTSDRTSLETSHADNAEVGVLLREFSRWHLSNEALLETAYMFAESEGLHRTTSGSAPSAVSESNDRVRPTVNEVPPDASSDKPA